MAARRSISLTRQSGALLKSWSVRIPKASIGSRPCWKANGVAAGLLLEHDVAAARAGWDAIELRLERRFGDRFLNPNLFLFGGLEIKNRITIKKSRLRLNSMTVGQGRS